MLILITSINSEVVNNQPSSKKIKFAHLADCHIGGWREVRLHNASQLAFRKAIDYCINERVNFLIIAGDLFNNAIPAIDILKETISDLKRLKDSDIPVYIVSGSHDYSASGKTIIEVLEKAGFVIDVVRGSIIDNKLKLNFTIDKKTGIKLTGIIGKKGSLEKKYYENLDYSIENEPGFKIFIFHTAISELMPKDLKEISSMTLKSLPGNFNYYAAGHVHEIIEQKKDGFHLIYPGPIFPNSFRELEKLNNGGFYVVDVDLVDYSINSKHIPIILHNYDSIVVDCNNKTPQEINEEVLNIILKREFVDSIVTLRLKGILKSGYINEIKLDYFISKLYERGAYVVLRSTTQLELKTEKKEIIIDANNANIEYQLIDSLKDDNLKEISLKLMNVLSNEKHDGEKVYDYEARIIGELKSIFALN